MVWDDCEYCVRDSSGNPFFFFGGVRRGSGTEKEKRLERIARPRGLTCAPARGYAHKPLSYFTFYLDFSKNSSIFAARWCGDPGIKNIIICQ